MAVMSVLAGCEATIVEPTLPAAWTEELAREPLTRAQCITLATTSAPTAAAWEARRLGARARLDQASLLPNPTLSLGWEDFGLNDAASGSKVQTTLSLAMSLADVAARKRRAAAARSDLDAEEADCLAERQRLAAEVCLAYDELLVARARVALQAELAEIAGRQRHDVDRFVDSGVAPRFDLERAEAEAVQSLADVAAARADARALELEFTFALGFERPLSLVLADPLETDVTVSDAAPLAELLAAAAAARPELAAARARYDAERERLSLAAERVQFLPTIGAGPRTLDGQLLGVAGLDVELPLFDAGAAAEQAEQASLLAAAAVLRATAQEVARQVCVALDRSQSAQDYLSEHARALADRRRALRERTERLFQAGEAEYGDLAVARRDEVDARLALLDAEGAAASARTLLEAALGRLPNDDP